MEAFITYRHAQSFPDIVEGSPLEMAEADFERYLVLLATGEHPLCHISGNEPALHSSFERFIAMGVERKISVTVETTGLMPESAAEAIIEVGAGVALRLYHPDLYQQNRWEEMVATCRRFAETLKDRMLVTVLVHDPKADYSFAKQFVEDIDFPRVGVQVLQPLRSDQLSDLSAWISSFAIDNMMNGRQVFTGCGLSPCALTDSAYGRLAKLGAVPPLCGPIPGVLPDLRLYLCRAMIYDRLGSITRFSHMNQVYDFLFQPYAGLQHWHVLGTLCETCIIRDAGNCVGHCMVVMQEDLKRESEKSRKSQVVPSHPRRMVKRGLMHWLLGEMEEAKELLLAARRLEPERDEIHALLGGFFAVTGEFEEADKEYEKATRLAPRSKAVFIHWSELHEKRRNFARALQLLERAATLGEAEGWLERRLAYLRQLAGQ